MRIQIHAGQGPRPSADNLPPPLARLSPSGELVLVELQGSLEMDGLDEAGGQTIGVLRFPQGREVGRGGQHRISQSFKYPIIC